MLQKLFNHSKHNTESLLLALYTIGSAIPFLATFKTSAIVGYTEFHILNSAKITDLYSSWQTLNLGQSGAANLWRLFPLDGFYYLLNYGLHFNPAITQALFLAVLSTIGFLSFYSLIKNLFTEIKFSSRIIGSFVFIFNVYNLINVSSSFAFIIPYVFLPLQLLILIKGLRSRTMYFGVLLGIINAAMFGVNLAYSAMALMLLIVIGTWNVLMLHKSSFKRLIWLLIVSGIVTIGLSSWWLIPMIYASLVDAQTTSYILGSETFNGLDSTPVNIFRNLGDWSFFGGYKSILYHRISAPFKNNLLVIITSFVPSIIVLTSYIVLFSKQGVEKLLKKQIIVFFLIILVLIPVIGNTNVLWPTHSVINWIFNNVPFSMAFRSTYKFTEITVFLYAIIITIFIDYLLKKFKYQSSPKIFLAILASIGITVIANSSPLWVGNLYENKSLISSLPTYWDQMASYVNHNLNGNQDRILLTPNQYFPAFQWNGEQKALPSDMTELIFNTPTVHGTCRGCAPPNSANLLDYIYNNLDQPNIAQLLGTLNIDYILQRNDFDYKYYNQPSPADLKRVLSNTNLLSLKKSIGKLDLYSVDKRYVNDRVYSPTQILSTDSLSDTQKSFSKSEPNLSKAFSIDAHGKIPDKFYPIENEYIRLFDQANSNINKDEISQKINIDSDTQFRLSSDFNQTDVLNAENLSNHKSINIKNNLINLKKGKYIISSPIKVTKDNLIANGSYQDGIWQKKVGNCNLQHSNANLNATLGGGINGTSKSLILSADTDTACEYSPGVKNFNRLTNYVFSFDYKVLQGDHAAYCIWDGLTCLETKAIVNNKIGSWEHIDVPVKPKITSKSLKIYFYAEAENKSSKVEYANLNVNSFEGSYIDNYSLFPDQAKVIKPIQTAVHKINNSKYIIDAKFQDIKSQLVLQEAYSPGWRAYIVPTNVAIPKWKSFLPLSPNGYLVPTKNHVVSNGFANGWWIDQSAIPSQYKNSDAEYKIILEYWPQRYFYSSILLSVAISIPVILYLVIQIANKRSNNDEQVYHDTTIGSRRLSMNDLKREMKLSDLKRKLRK